MYSTKRSEDQFKIPDIFSLFSDDKQEINRATTRTTVWLVVVWRGSVGIRSSETNQNHFSKAI